MEVESVEEEEEDQSLDENEKALLKQDEILKSIKEKISNLDREQLADILRHNNQDLPIGVDKVKQLNSKHSETQQLNFGFSGFKNTDDRKNSRHHGFRSIGALPFLQRPVCFEVRTYMNNNTTLD
jgi:hypothetical protein